MAGTKRQTRMQFRRQPKSNNSNAPAPPISTLLSQYELLASLCKHLSSADIIHLGATNREHWLYVASSPLILKGLIAESVCDGRGIAAQARVFGHWKNDPTQATRTCRGRDAMPCDDCGAMVCNACRFHVQYPSRNLREDDDDIDRESVASFDEEEWDDLEYVVCTQIEEEGLPHDTIEIKKASEILCGDTWESFCGDCEPLCLQIEDAREFCNCGLYNNFVRRWRCIPCVMAEQTRSILNRQRYKLKLMPSGWYIHMFYCACGKPIHDSSIEVCRKCRLLVTWRSGPERQERLLKRIYAQLGTSTDGRSEDAILSQLG